MKLSLSFSDKAIYTCSVCVVLSFLLQIFKINFLVTLVYSFSLLYVFLLFALKGRYSRLILCLIAALAVATVANGFVLGNADYILHVLIVVCSFICIEESITAKISSNTFKKISVLFLISALVVCIGYYLGPLKSTYFKHTDVICLNFSNPNAAGLWLTCYFILLAYSSFLYSGLKKVAFIATAIGLLPIIYATESRNSFFACLFLVGGILLAKIFKIKKIPKWMVAVIACLPLIVFAFYMSVIVNNIDFWNSIFNMGDIDKGIDSRQDIWQGVLDNFWDCFLLGNYPKYYDSQQHNSLLTIFCRFGMPVTALVCVLIYRALEKIQERSSFFAMISISAVFFTGCFEASVFTGIAGLYLMILIIPACASAEASQQEPLISDQLPCGGRSHI